MAEQDQRFTSGTAHIARGVLLAVITVAALAGFLALFVGVATMRLAWDRAAVSPPAGTSAGISSPSIGSSSPRGGIPRGSPPLATGMVPASAPPAAGSAAEPQHTSAPAASHASALLLRLDDDSAGGWVGQYGKKGYSLALPGEPTSLPPSVPMSMDGSHFYLWSPVTTDPRGLSVPSDPRRLSAGQWFAWDRFSLDLDLRAGGKDVQVALYLLDWDSDARAQRLEVTDAQTGALLLTRTDEHFRKGRYVILRLSGHVVLHFTKTAGANCTLSGIFLDDVPELAP